MQASGLFSIVITVLWAATALAATPPEVSLNNCQNAVKLETANYVKNKVAAVGTCLQKISIELVKKNAADTSGAASACVAQFRKLNDSHPGKSLSAKLAANIATKCTPMPPAVTHTLADILGSGAGVAQPLTVENINAWCARFGGDGSVDSVQEWTDCIAASAECAVDATISTQYPRALEWLDLVRPKMLLVPAPATDPMKSLEAAAGLDAVRRGIAGPGNGATPNLQCGRTDFVATGQQTAYTADKNGAPGANVADDGTRRAGAALRYVDNDNGTITDLNTGLVWEKKSDDGGLHDMDNVYPWSDASNDTIWDWLDQVNSEGGGGFAGHNDWRIPNLRELESIVDYEIPFPGPTVADVFNSNCNPPTPANCTVAQCSCTAGNFYWSSTTWASDVTAAWQVPFDGSGPGALDKASATYVRAVRGGS